MHEGHISSSSSESPSVQALGCGFLDSASPVFDPAYRIHLPGIS